MEGGTGTMMKNALAVTLAAAIACVLCVSPYPNSLRHLRYIVYAISFVGGVGVNSFLDKPDMACRLLKALFVFIFGATFGLACRANEAGNYAGFCQLITAVLCGWILHAALCLTTVMAGIGAGYSCLALEQSMSPYLAWLSCHIRNDLGRRE